MRTRAFSVHILSKRVLSYRSVRGVEHLTGCSHHPRGSALSHDFVDLFGTSDVVIRETFNVNTFCFFLMDLKIITCGFGIRQRCVKVTEKGPTHGPINPVSAPYKFPYKIL